MSDDDRAARDVSLLVALVVEQAKYRRIAHMLRTRPFLPATLVVLRGGLFERFFDLEVSLPVQAAPMRSANRRAYAADRLEELAQFIEHSLALDVPPPVIVARVRHDMAKLVPYLSGAANRFFSLVARLRATTEENLTHHLAQLPDDQGAELAMLARTDPVAAVIVMQASSRLDEELAALGSLDAAQQEVFVRTGRLPRHRG